MKHHIERTSPIGTTFFGTCRLCGMTGLRSFDAMKECPNPQGISEEQAMSDSIDGLFNKELDSREKGNTNDRT